MELCLDCAPQNDKMLAVLVKFISEKELLQFTKTLLKIRNIILSLNCYLNDIMAILVLQLL